MLNNLAGFTKAIPDILSFGLLGTSAQAGTLQDEGATAILLGGIIGGPMSMIGASREAKSTQQEQDLAKKRLEAVQNIFKLSARQFTDNTGAPLKTFGLNTDGTKAYLSPNNQVELDRNRLLNLTFNHLVNKNLFEEATHSLSKNDKFHIDYNTQKALAILGYQLGNIAVQQDLNNEDLD